MVMFGLGALVGGIIGLLICAVLSVNDTGREDWRATQKEKDIGEDNAGSE